ncbi:hypothetical protein LR48_Vigan2323s000100 [Vigna angularis]|uniref:Uncharacterized protein n=1 Tax=Vigna angularis var. angularis TaxID=157739 RepID=A0A0S3TER5_PHAAN|nr:hypothetical protein LR48_Vigan2323s000100 [Vigna angularis]BAU03607.1 hypothetical protein VIGAN_UM141700 [Vigna angularis var. angularis]
MLDADLLFPKTTFQRPRAKRPELSVSPVTKSSVQNFPVSSFFPNSQRNIPKGKPRKILSPPKLQTERESEREPPEKLYAPPF